MKLSVSKNNLLTNTIIFFLIFTLLFACDLKKTKNNYTCYRAVNGKDTAYLKLGKDQNRFWGNYEIRYGKTGKDSGDVRGEFLGDTLRGTFSYLSFGGNWKKTPIALLKKNNTLILGKGVAAILMDMPIYLPEIPIDYSNPEFIFEEIKPKKMDKESKK